MRIAQIAPLWEALPGGESRSKEYYISLLTDELVSRGHEVTLFAASDSDSLAWLAPGAEPALLEAGIREQDYLLYEQMQLSRVFNCPGRFDIIHSHIGYAALPYANLVKMPVLHTLHDPLTPTAAQLYAQHRKQVFVGFSQQQQLQQQRQLSLSLNYAATIPCPLDLNRFRFYARGGEPSYVAWLGEMRPETGAALAIDLAQQLNLEIRLATPAEVEDWAFFRQEIAPRLDGRRVRFLGPLGDWARNEFLGRAIALLYCPTPKDGDMHGYSLLESLASGTPIVAPSHSLAAEFVVNGTTGWLCDRPETLVQALGKVQQLDRQTCRQAVLEQFTIQHMADRYEGLYRQLLKDRFSCKEGERHTIPSTYRTAS